jgi:hypothetical protein
MIDSSNGYLPSSWCGRNCVCTYICKTKINLVLLRSRQNVHTSRIASVFGCDTLFPNVHVEMLQDKQKMALLCKMSSSLMICMIEICRTLLE